jgi:hypothetical protein
LTGRVADASIGESGDLAKVVDMMLRLTSSRPEIRWGQFFAPAMTITLGSPICVRHMLS